MDLLGYLLFAVALGGGLGVLAQRWLMYRQHLDVKRALPPKELTPQLVHRRIVKAQWHLLEQRMDHLTTDRRAIGFASEVSAVRIERNCVGVLWLAATGWTRNSNKDVSQPMPLCAENRARLEALGFRRFSDDGLWAFYVEPRADEQQ